VTGSLFRDLGILVVAGSLLALLARRFRIPALVAYIAAGLLVGPGAGLVSLSEAVELISEAGVALLLFLVGLELSLDRVREVGGISLSAGLLQVAITWTGGFALSLLMGLEPVPAAVVALAVTFSSTAVVVKLLEQSGQLQERHGRIAVGILLVQDLVVVLALTFLAGLAGGVEPGPGLVEPAILSLLPTGMTGALLGAFGGMFVLALVAAGASRYVLPPIFRTLVPDRDAIFLGSLFWCFLLIVGAEVFHLSLELGAFLAGIALAQLPGSHDLARRVSPLTNFFLAIFFVSLGVGMDPGAAAGVLPLVAVLSAFVVLGKGSLVTWLLRRLGQTGETAFRTGLTLAQASEFSFILVALAASAGLVGEELTAAVAVTGLLTIGVSSFGVLESEAIYRTLGSGPLGRIVGAVPRGREDRGSGEPSGHVIVVGMNPLGRTLVRRLTEADHPVTAVDTNPLRLRGLPGRTVHGNVQDPAVLIEAGLSRARLLVSALRIEDVNFLLARRCAEAGVPSAIHAFDASVMEKLLDAGADHLIVSWDEGTRRVAAHLKRLGILG